MAIGIARHSFRPMIDDVIRNNFSLEREQLRVGQVDRDAPNQYLDSQVSTRVKFSNSRLVFVL